MAAVTRKACTWDCLPSACVPMLSSDTQNIISSHVRGLPLQLAREYLADEARNADSHGHFTRRIASPDNFIPPNAQELSGMHWSLAVHADAVDSSQHARVLHRAGQGKSMPEIWSHLRMDAYESFILYPRVGKQHRRAPGEAQGNLQRVKQLSHYHQADEN